ncbi:MAG: hypothetical protein OEU86_03185 [Gammaproteobacteria bacterium]|nr:hypothetical protein [Gammaproteobacteria bacterium]
MSTLMDEVSQERRRLRNVRQTMAAAVEVGAQGENTFIEFYSAAANYIEVAMQRVHDQDIKMKSMILDKVEKADSAVKQAIQELDDRLEGAAKELPLFLEARDALLEQGASKLSDFEVAAQRYSDFIVSNMGHHPATADLAAKLFSVPDWEYMAGRGAEQIKAEVQLFDRVMEKKPARLSE